MNAEYKKVSVSLFHVGQYRKLVLHVVKPMNKESLYFLFDYFGWAIDNVQRVQEAARLFVSGEYTEIKN